MATEIFLEKELFRFGLSQSEIKVYDFLLRNGESEISEVSRKMKMAPTNVYPIVKTLMNKGIVESMFTKPVKFLAVQMIEGLDMLIMHRKVLLSREVDSLEKIKENIAREWQNIRVEKEKAEPERFQILREGSIYSKLLVSLDNISKNLYLYMGKRNFVKLYNTDFLDELAKRIEKRTIRAVFLLDESLRNIDMKGVNAEVKFVKEAHMNEFLVFDDKEVFYYLDKPTTSEEDTVLWTTLPSLALIFKNMFEMKVTQLEEEPHKIEGYQDFLLAKKFAKKLFSSLLDGCEESAITGISGCKHEFDMLLKANSKITAVDFLSSKQPINVQQVLPFYVKTYDLKGFVTNFVLLVNGEIDQEAEEFLKDHKIDLEVFNEA